MGAWLCVAWAMVALLLTALAAAPGLLGCAASAIRRCVVPTAMRHAFEAALGISIVATPVLTSSTPAFADNGQPRPAWSAPSLDRPVGDAGPAPQTYVVRHGDCLWSIARKHLTPAASDNAVAREWPRWYDANRRLIGADPNLVLPGERLTVPASDREPQR
jgi:nucleoid-associated protein YgaU